MAYDLTPVDGNCPICSSRQAELLHTITSDFTAQYYALKESEPERHEKIKGEIERLWEGKECRILRCRECGFIYADPFIAGDSPFYSLFYENPKFPKWKWEYEETWQHLRNAVERGELEKPRVLEIGAGTGMFVSKIREITSPDRIVTVEYSDAGKRAIEEMGIRCEQQDVTMLGEEFTEYFDAICMYQVLEHMTGLDEVFAKLYQLARPGGFLFVAVPGGDMLTLYEEKEAWLDNAPVHVSRWNEKSFRMIGEKHGWELESYAIEPTGQLWKFLQFSLYKYVHRTKRSGTFYNWAESRKNRLLRYLFQVPLISYVALGSLGTIPTLTSPRMGSVQLVRFRKSESRP